MFVFGQEEARAAERWAHTPRGRFALEAETDAVLKLLEPRPGEKLLDIGCGNGLLMAALADAGLAVSGIDPSEPMLALARARLGPEVPLHQGFAERLPFDEASFDYATFMTSLEFVQDPVRALREALRVTRRRVVVGLLNPMSLYGAGCLIRGLRGHGVYSRARFFAPWRLGRLIASAGPVRVRWLSVLSLPPGLARMAPELERRLSFRANPFGGLLAFALDPVCRCRTSREVQVKCGRGFAKAGFQGLSQEAPLPPV